MSDCAADETERQKYLRNDELREQIAYAVGGDPSRYNGDSKRGLRKADVIRVAEALRPGGNDLDFKSMTLDDLYDRVCEWTDGEHQSNVGRPWGINRENLKKIHQAVGGRDPHEGVSA